VILETHWSYAELDICPVDVVLEIIAVLNERAEAYEKKD
jgi:hypothetical protein